MYQEDAPSITLFNSKKKGFRYWPTTFYTYPFWKKYYEIRNGPHMCHNKMSTYLTWLEQIRIFMESAKKKQTPYFSFSFLTELTHDHLAIPRNFDRHLKNFLENLINNGNLDNTLLVVLSDHGNRLHKYSYTTNNGRTERYMPFLSVKLPKKLIGTKYHEIALANKNKLVTLFDVHQTLRHFLYLNTFDTTKLNVKSCQNQFKTNSIYQRNMRGTSLLNPIQLNRTCSDALISAEFCNCYKKEEIEESIFKKETGHSFNSASLLALDLINNLTSKVRFKCELFKLSQIVSLRKTIFNRENIYTEILILDPGQAWFEVTFKIKDDTLVVNDVPIRLSAYGSQAKCIDNDAFLPSYCFCKNMK